MLPPEHLALGSAIIFVAFLVRGFGGFGAALVSTPLLVLFLDFKLVVACHGILSVISGIQLARSARHACATEELPPLLIGLIAGLGIGVSALVRFSTPELKRAFGVFTMVVALRMLAGAAGTGRRFARRWGWVWGLVGGVTGGVFGASGPPTIFYLYGRLDNARALRATILVAFLASDSVRLLILSAAGMITPAVLQAATWFVPASIAGSALGTRLHLRVNEVVLRRTISILLLSAGFLFAAGR
ncbi:MAG: sulfite exporter TauE/SafE family protein [Armatimonadota bacterium]|nr:sulfite exporter TauE/SafE family protein [Armatimonadota bacterium]